MNMKKLRQVLACVLALAALICSVPTGAQAATYQKVYAVHDGARLYKGASTDSAVLRSVPLNAMITLGIAKNSWCYVKYDGTVGYMRTADLAAAKVEVNTSIGESSDSQPTPAPTAAPDQSGSSSSSSSGIAAVITKTTKLYENARTDASSYCTLYGGAKVVCLKLSGSWARVSYNGQIGYVPKSYLAQDTNPAPVEPTPAPSQTEQPAQNTGSSEGVKVRTVTAAKFYKRADTASGSLATVAKGKEFICLKTSGAWARVQIGSNIGYMLKSALARVSENSGSESSGSETVAPDPTQSPSSVSGVVCYIKEDSTLYKSADTSAEAAASLEKGDKVYVVQVKSGWAKLYTKDTVLGYLPSSLLSKTAVTPSPKVVLADWFKSDIQSIFARGSVVKVIDVATRKSFNIRRTGGILHADVEPVATSDTATMLAVYGGQWSWDRRAIWVVIDGVYYAASMNGMGHGSEPDTDNEFDGIFCIHFLNSRTHGTDNVCPLHQAAIKQAYTTKP